jgi:predicted SprT family Zn-dependent metalloprotease
VARGSFTRERPIDRLIQTTVWRLGLDGDMPKIQHSFDGRLKRSLGIAHWPEHRVLLSTPIWGRLSVAERRETIVHEVCHLTTWNELGYVPKDLHCDLWREHMSLCGYANATITVELP